MADTIDLNGDWELRAIDAYGRLPPVNARVKDWFSAQVPGTVHTDLMRDGLIPDPFYRMNENDVQWVDGVQWLYRRTFTVTEDILAQSNLRLRADGLDTYAKIHVNGKLIGQSSNMFVEHFFPLKGVLCRGDNTIEILFDSPTVRARSIEKKHGSLRVALESHRVYVRKAQYSFGWDWGPKLTTSGIWRSIGIEGFSGAQLSNANVRVKAIRADEAVVKVSADIEGRVLRNSTIRIDIRHGDWHSERLLTIRKKLTSVTIRIPRPQLWWPNGCGEQPLYEARFTLLHGETPVHEQRVLFGIRTIRLLQEKDEEGRSFILEVNGRKIFCKGADWIPSDTFLPRVPESRYDTLLGLARDAHMNMIRVWGGGIYESDTFYEFCDRYGLMVWQDFMFACGEYPEVRWFIKDVKDEAVKTIRRLRNHPSIVLWCGNNECEWLFCAETPGRRPDEMTGSKIFRDLLPSVCASEDGTRPYWRSTPFGTGFPNSESNGNHHQWNVWSNWKDFTGYRDVKARFVSEFGFQAPAHLRTMEACTLPEDRHPQSKVIEHHNKQAEGPERLFRFMGGHFRVQTAYDRFIYLTQLVQAEALKCAVEHWRRRKYKTAGSLFWQLNDCWPVSSWAVVDSALRPKAAYYFSKRFFAPILVSFKSEGTRIGVWVTNDTQAQIAGQLRMVRQTFEGRKAWDKLTSVRVSADSSQRVASIGPSMLDAVQSNGEYLLAELKAGGSVAATNRYFFDEPKHLNLPDPGVVTELRDDGEGRFVLSLKARRLARGVRVEIEGEDVIFDENWIDIDPEGSQVIRFASPAPLGSVRERLQLEWLH